MDATLKSIRELLFQDRAWASSGKSLDRKANRSINRSLAQLAGDVPEAILPERFHTRVYTPIDGSDSDVNTTISATNDPKVLKFVRGSGSTWSPVIDGTWDGLMHLDVKTSDGVVRRRQSREWFSVTVDATTTYYVSIDKPWRNTTDTGLTFVIHQPEFFLPGNTIRVLDPINIHRDGMPRVMHVSGGAARRNNLPDYEQNSKGRPESFYRTRRFSIPAPTTAPILSKLEGADNSILSSWLGPVQEGKFRACYTYVWGRVDQDYSDSPTGIRDPIWESAPSPLSDYFDHALDENHNLVVNPEGYAINITFDNIDQILDFVGLSGGIDLAATYPPAAPLRFGRSGLRVRIYIFREEVYKNHGPTASMSAVISSQRYNDVHADGRGYLLAEVDPLEKDPVALAMSVNKISSYTWQGALPVPDHERPLRKVTGYYAYRLDPVPDEDYTLDIDILRQPVELVDDNDTVPVEPSAMSAFLELCLMYMCRMDGVDMHGEEKHRRQYERARSMLRATFGDSGGVVSPQSWVAVRQGHRYTKMSEG